MKTYKIAIAIASLALVATSCIKETFPTGYATKEQIGASAVALAASVNAIPAQMTGPYPVYGEQNYEFDMGYPGMMIIRDSAAGEICDQGETGYDWFSYWPCHMSLGAEIGTTYVPWFTYYKFIKSANDIITAINPEEATAETIVYLGQAYAYRAMEYLDLVRMYSFKEVTDPNVKGYTPEGDIKGLSCVLVNEKTTLEQAKNNPRVNEMEMYNNIISDLNNAAKYIGDYVPSTTLNPGQAFVNGLFARTYLEMATASLKTDEAKATEYYKSAADYAAKAIAAKGGSPLTQSQWEDPVTGFNNASANSNSWILHVSYSAENMGNLCNFVAHMSTEETWTSYGWKVGRGISRSIYDRIPDTDWRKHSWIDPAGKDYYAYKTNRNVFGDDKHVSAYANLKFRPASGDYATYKVGGASDVPVMRVEEMYYIKAEAEAMSGNLGAGIATLTELMLTRNPNYSCKADNASAFVNEVFFQKRVEFWGEGIIFFDCKRLEAGVHNFYDGTNYPSGYAFNVNGIDPAWNFTIPQSEVEGNPAIQGLNNPDATDTLLPLN